jgi:hypothetical protein
MRLTKVKWLKKLENIQQKQFANNNTFDATKNLNLMLVLVVRVVMKKKQELKNVFFLFVMILVNGMRKTNVRNYSMNGK